MVRRYRASRKSACSKDARRRSRRSTSTATSTRPASTTARCSRSATKSRPNRKRRRRDGRWRRRRSTFRPASRGEQPAWRRQAPSQLPIRAYRRNGARLCRTASQSRRQRATAPCIPTRINRKMLRPRSIRRRAIRPHVRRPISRHHEVVLDSGNPRLQQGQLLRQQLLSRRGHSTAQHNHLIRELSLD